LVKNGLQGCVLVFAVMWLFFNARLSFWVVFSLPVSFLASFAFVPTAGLTINMLTMVGLLMAIGLLMDDGIVIAENIARRRQEGEPAMTAAINGVKEVAGGVFRVIQKSNWKIFFENLNDTGHPVATHESSFMAARRYSKDKLDGKLPFELHIIDGNGEPFKFWESLELRAFDYGHSYMSSIFKAPQDALFQQYRAQLEAAYGPERTDDILGITRHNTIIYPSCSPHTSFQQLRVIRPLSIDRTLVEIFTFRLKGTSDEFFQRTLTYTNVVNSPSSIVMADDIEVYRRCQEGLVSDGGDWISQHRHVGRDEPYEGEGGGYVSVGSSEMPIRNQFRAWKSYMTAEA